MSNLNKTTSKNIKEIPLSKHPILIISKRLQNEILYLHKQVKQCEWSGILFYTQEKGSIKDLDNLVLKADCMHLMDIGTSAYTSYDFDESMIDLFMERPEVEEMKMGMIHTHHNMNSFFSATDTSELKDNAQNHNYYLSLIVNFDGNWCAKVALHSPENKTSAKIKDEEGNYIELPLIENEEIIYTCETIIDIETDTFLKERYDVIKKKSIEKSKKVPYTAGYSRSNYKGYSPNNKQTYLPLNNKPKLKKVTGFYNPTKEEKTYYNKLCQLLQLDNEANNFDLEGIIDKINKEIIESEEGIYLNFIEDNILEFTKDLNTSELPEVIFYDYVCELFIKFLEPFYENYDIVQDLVYTFSLYITEEEELEWN